MKTFREKLIHNSLHSVILVYSIQHEKEQVCIPVGCVPPTSVATVNRMTDRQV